MITPANAAEHAGVAQVEAVTGQRDRSRVRVVGDLDGSQRAWLFVSTTSVDPCRPRFRDRFWFGAENEKVERWIQLFPGQTLLPGWRGHLFPFVELELPPEQIRRACNDIDYPHPVDDGGYYHSIDLADYLEGPPGKKRDLQWEGH